VKQVRNAHNYLADFEAELPLYSRAGELVRFLRGCGVRATEPGGPPL